MNLVVDIGNSAIKCAWFNQRELSSKFHSKLDELDVALDSFITKHEVHAVAISNVNQRNLPFLEKLIPFSPLNIDHETPLPIKLEYDTPQSLGIDRICGAVAAHCRFPDHPVLSIDIGSCITYDFTTVKGNYRGGGIAPGYKMRLQAMHHFTERLPVVNPTDSFLEYGRSTKSSMIFGAGFGIVAELNGIIKRFQTEHPKLKVILTGGDHPMFEQHVENPIFAAPNLVLEGINEILLQHNTSHD